MNPSLSLHRTIVQIEEAVYSIRPVSQHRIEAANRARRAFFAEHLGTFSERIFKSLLEDHQHVTVALVSFSNAEEEGERFATWGLTNPHIDAGEERTGVGYELFVATPVMGQKWPLHLLAYLAQLELVEGIDLMGHLSEHGAVTVEQMPVDTGNPAMTALLFATSGQRENTPEGLLQLIAVTLIYEDELAWALRYGGPQLEQLLFEAGIGYMSDPHRPSCLDRSDLADTIVSLQQVTWYQELDDAEYADYLINEAGVRYGTEWDVIRLEMDHALSMILVVERSGTTERVTWQEGAPPPVLEASPLVYLPEMAHALADHMTTVAAQSEHLEENAWNRVALTITRQADDELEIDWYFEYPDSD